MHTQTMSIRNVQNPCEKCTRIANKEKFSSVSEKKQYTLDHFNIRDILLIAI